MATLIDKRAVRTLLGETMRDVGILLFVFFPMDAYFQPAPRSSVGVALVLGVALLFIVFGIIFEANEQE